MSVEFGVREFFDPAAIFRHRFLFQKSQRFDAERMRQFQERRLSEVTRHALKHVPFYREWADREGVEASGIRTLQDLAKLPRLTASAVRHRPASLHADDAAKFRPATASSSGTAGQGLSFWLDRSTNAVEFNYYWRYWNWAGYRLGDPFAEFSCLYFMKPGNERLSHRRAAATGRLLLNSLSLSKAGCAEHARLIALHRAKFLKGLPSVLYHFALFLRQSGISLRLKAVFSTGEVLTPLARAAIESAFGCKVYDSYGQMQRLVAVSECPSGGLHVNSDYGLLELVDREPADPPAPGRFRARMLGTSLYNFSMPLLRFDLGDIAEADENPAACPCGCTFPLIRRIEGREEDVIVTPDGRVVTTLFLAFSGVRGIRLGQIEQDSRESLIVRLVRGGDFGSTTEPALVQNIRMAVGGGMRITFLYLDRDEDLLVPGRKFKSVLSRLKDPLGFSS